MPATGKMPAKRLLIIDLGDSQSYTPQRMELVGSIVYREARRLGVESPFFAPTVLDGSVTGFGTDETAEWFIRGFLHAAVTQKQLVSAGDSGGVTIRELTFLAGAQHAKTHAMASQKLTRKPLGSSRAKVSAPATHDPIARHPQPRYRCCREIPSALRLEKARAEARRTSG